MGIIYLTTNKINNRKYIGVDSQNNKSYFGSGKAIRLAIKKYGTKSFTKEILEESDDKEYLFEREKYYIEIYDAINSNEYYNMAEGGKGGAGTLATEEAKEAHRIGCKKGLEKISELRRGKTYEEIYGDRADEEKEKRRLAGLGKKYDEERTKKSGDGHKCQIPWNKGKKGLQIPWNKGLITLQEPWQKGKKYVTKKYILTLLNNEEIEFLGRDSLEKYIKETINPTLIQSRINIIN